jgi:integrase
VQKLDKLEWWEQHKETKLLFSSIKSKDTAGKYKSYFKKYQELTGLTIDAIIAEKDPRTIEFQIIDFINKMKDEGKTWGAIHNYLAMILAFYKINDIVLNVAKINKFMPEQRKVRKKDRGYTNEEIGKMLSFCDERTRVIVLLLASTGIRIGALSNLRVGNLDNGNNKLIVYENDKEEYYTFVTPECKEAIDSYLDMRSRYGEEIEDNCFLIREQFDKRDNFAIAHCKGMARETLQWMLKDIAKRSNVRSKEVAVAHGFRKFFTTQLVNSDVNPERREMLLGHKIGLASAYYKPTVENMQQEYQKAVNSLTINQENRLKIKVENLEKERTGYDFLNQKIESIQSGLVEIMKMATMNKSPEEVQELYKSFQSMGKMKNDI